MTYTDPAELLDAAPIRQADPRVLVDQAVDPAPKPPSLLAGLRTGAWLDAQQFPPLQYAVPGLIPEGSSLLVGPPKAGKSWLALDTALAVAGGGRALGQLAVDPRPVLLLALEDGDRRLQERARALLGPGEPIPAGLMYLTRLEHGKLIPTVVEWLDAYGGDGGVVYLDTLGKVMPPALVGESAYQRDYRVGSTLKRAIDEHPGSSLVTLHHDRKAGSDDFVDAVSGTHGLAGAADSILVLARRRGESTAVLKVTGRDVPEGEYALSLTDGRWTLDGDGLDAAAVSAQLRQENAVLGDLSMDVLAFVNDFPDGVTPALVATQLGIANQVAGKYLGRLADSGRVRKLKRGHYGPLHTPGVWENGKT